MAEPNWVKCRHLFVEPTNAKEPNADITERLRAEITARDASAAVLSNLGKPRSDNNDGRCAQLLEDSVAEIERLRARVAEPEAYVAFLEGGPMSKQEPLKTVTIPLSRELTSQELAQLQAYPDEIMRLRSRVSMLEASADVGNRRAARIIKLEAENKKLQDRVSEYALDELSRLGQEVDAQLTPEDHEAIMGALCKGLLRSVTMVAKEAPPFEVPQD